MPRANQGPVQCQAIVDVHQTALRKELGERRCHERSVSCIPVPGLLKEVHLCWLHAQAFKNQKRRTRLWCTRRRPSRLGGVVVVGTMTERSGSIETESASSSASAALGLPESSASPAGDE
jgi:hypothetical protein